MSVASLTQHEFNKLIDWFRANVVLGSPETLAFISWMENLSADFVQTIYYYKRPVNPKAGLCHHQPFEKGNLYAMAVHSRGSKFNIELRLGRYFVPNEKELIKQPAESKYEWVIKSEDILSFSPTRLDELFAIAYRYRKGGGK